MIEIWVTHRVDAEKRRKIESLGIATVEFDFSQMDRVVTKDDLRAALVRGNRLPGRGWGAWVFHRDQAKTQEELDQEFLAKKDALLEELRRKGKQLREDELNCRLQEYARQAAEQLAEKRSQDEQHKKREFLF